MKTRKESDSMGEMNVPADAYYGAQTARAVENFPVSGLRFPRAFIRAIALIKKNAAVVNQRLGLLKKEKAEAIQRAAQEVIEGKWDGEFVVDIFQTGSGTSTNMNANEVIANRAIEIMGGQRGDRSIHPNDDVNRCQSTNDVVPTAIQLAAIEQINTRLIPALGELHTALSKKAQEFSPVLKIGRTHLQDATPMRLGQEFSGYAAQVADGIRRLRMAMERLGELPLGGTAIGTGINAHAHFAQSVITRIAGETGLSVRETSNHFAAQGTIDAMVEASGALKGLALSLMKIANDIRWLGSGPRCGLGELKLPATQPGSSIMPGKVNPVMCEMLIQVCAQVIGNDAVISLAATQGAFELNTMLPVSGYNLLQGIELLANGCGIFARRCVVGLAAVEEKCRENVEKSLGMATSLAPVIGYDQAAKIAKAAYESGRTVRETALEMAGLDGKRLEELMDPESQV